MSVRDAPLTMFGNVWLLTISGVGLRFARDLRRVAPSSMLRAKERPHASRVRVDAENPIAKVRMAVGVGMQFKVDELAAMRDQRGACRRAHDHRRPDHGLGALDVGRVDRDGCAE